MNYAEISIWDQFIPVHDFTLNHFSVNAITQRANMYTPTWPFRQPTDRPTVCVYK